MHSLGREVTEDDVKQHVFFTVNIRFWGWKQIPQKKEICLAFRSSTCVLDFY
jgi:hypothetical protein